MPRSFDIFCRVIDNYGDVGVCWRLARQLASPPFSACVRLWVDDVARCHALVPAVDPQAGHQQCEGVDIYRWHATTNNTNNAGNAAIDPDTPATSTVPAEVVIEAFGCELPAAFIARMGPETVWINLEYLSAEAWVEGCHGLPSPQAGGLRKWFFFPGFTPATGGLLREPDLPARRDTWQADPQARWNLLRSLRLSETAWHALQQGARQILLFCYPHAPVAELLQGLRRAGAPAVVLAAPGAVNDDCRALARDACVQVCDIPFVPQAAFDALLWGSDLNCVRGEDSIVRALWAGKPLLWHIYPQAQDAHRVKLDAWLARAPWSNSVAGLIRAWNDVAPDAPNAPPLAHLLAKNLAPAAWQAWCNAAQGWSRTLGQHTDLTSALVAFCAGKRQNR